jgi:homoserine kinase
MPEAFDVAVPASSANLGPGFDAIGLALNLWVRASVRPAASFSLGFSPGRHAPTNPGFGNEILRGLDAVLDGARPAVAIEVRNDIPLGKGLGASAAGAVLGLVAGAEMAPRRPSAERLAQLATELEGHPDNALPALLGGIVVAAQREGAPPAFLRFAAPPKLAAVVVTPHIVLPTAAARALLPASYERRDAVFNIQRAALLAVSLARGDLRFLRAASEDRIHQPYRAPLVPGFEAMLGLALPGLYAVTLSGAGPSVLALVATADDAAGVAVGEALAAEFAREGIESDIYRLAIASQGAYAAIAR